MGTRPFMETTPTGASVAVLPDAESLAVAVAALIAEEARRAVGERGRFTIALSGGSTPQPVYRLLATPPFSELVPWDSIEVFWGDERCVDFSDPRSNERMAREALLDHVPVPADRVHPMRCTGPGAGNAQAGEGVPHGRAAAQRAADEYEVLLRKRFAGSAARSAAGRGPAAAPRKGCGVRSAAAGGGVDLVLLGIGDNGHTASLFPGSEALDVRDRWAVEALEDPDTAAATSGTGERLWRVTLTAPFINRAALVLFVVSEGSKGPVVNAALRGEGDPHELPVLLIRPEAGRQWWLLDEAAASQFRAAGPAHRPGTTVAADVAESFDDLPECEGGPSR